MKPHKMQHYSSGIALLLSRDPYRTIGRMYPFSITMRNYAKMKELDIAGLSQQPRRRHDISDDSEMDLCTKLRNCKFWYKV